MTLERSNYLSLLAARFQNNGLSIDGGKRWNYGAFALLLTLTTLFLNAFILTEYEALQPLFAPIIIITVIGLWGMVLGLIVMKPKFDRFMLGLSVAVIVGIIGLIIISIFSGFFTRGSGFSLLGIPNWVTVLIYGGVGVMETSFFQGIQAVIRTYWARNTLSIGLLFLFMFVGGVMWHQAIGRHLFRGSIFDAPGYIFFVGVSWVLFAGLLELTGWMDVPMGAHWFWNVSITMMQVY